MSDSGDTVAARSIGGEANGKGWAARLKVEPWKVAKFVAALLLLPLCAGVAVAFQDCFWGLGTKLRVATLGWPELWRWFGLGVGLYTLVGILLWRPVMVYAFAHEMAHSLATWLCLGKVTNFRAATNGGEVTVSKSNTLIRLAPYVLPLYALLVAAVFLGFELSGRSLDQPKWLAVLLGFTLTFHVGFTLWSLHRGQSDLKQDGWFFSLVVIFLINAVFLAAFLGLALSGKAAGGWETFRFVCQEGWEHSQKIFRDLFKALGQAVRS